MSCDRALPVSCGSNIDYSGWDAHPDSWAPSARNSVATRLLLIPPSHPPSSQIQLNTALIPLFRCHSADVNDNEKAQEALWQSSASTEWSHREPQQNGLIDREAAGDGEASQAGRRICLTEASVDNTRKIDWEEKLNICVCQLNDCFFKRRVVWKTDGLGLWWGTLLCIQLANWNKLKKKLPLWFIWVD